MELSLGINVMNPIDERKQQLTRRSFLGLSSTCLGAAALNSLLSEDAFAQSPQAIGGLSEIPHFAPKAKRVIYLFQSGGPSQHELCYRAHYRLHQRRRFGGGTVLHMGFISGSPSPNDTSRAMV